MGRLASCNSSGRPSNLFVGSRCGRANGLVAAGRTHLTFAASIDNSGARPHPADLGEEFGEGANEKHDSAVGPKMIMHVN